MNNIVTPETALKLKEAGFPQPTPSTNQVWFNTSAQGVKVASPIKMIVLCPFGWMSYVVVNYGDHSPYSHPVTDGIFAPTAEDILQHLCGTLEYSETNGWWYEYRGEYMTGDNPAELLATIWLKEN